MKPRTIDAVLRKMSERKLTQSRLAALMGVLPQDITNWKSRGLPPAKLAAAAEALDCSVDELLGRLAREKPAPYLHIPEPQAHLLSPSRFDHPPIMDWGDIMQQGTDLPAEFQCAVPDDALSPSTPRGTRLIFALAALPRPGLGILVEDGAGFRYIRRYVQAAGERWQAAASRPDYATLDSLEHQLTLIAVATGRLDGTV